MLGTEEIDKLIEKYQDNDDLQGLIREYRALRLMRPQILIHHEGMLYQFIIAVKHELIRPREDKVEAIRSIVFHRLTIRVFLYSEGVRSYIFLNTFTK